MSEQQIYILLLIIITADFILERVLQYLNTESAKKAIPNELQGIYDEEKYAKSQAYLRTTSRFGSFTATLSFVLLLGAIYFGWFGLLDKWLRGFSPYAPVTSLLFFAVLFHLSYFMGIPFSWYRAFVIEERFGFNKMSQKTFWLDKVKEYFLSAIIGGVLLVALVWLIVNIGTDFWLYFWGIVTAFILFVNVFYTSLLLPLFNKLKPLEDGELKSSIRAYSTKVGFPLKNIFVIDGSKRSSKGNAFFSGLGKKKKVVLYDTLIEKHTVDELTAVFAHEVGHYKKKHILLATVISIATTGLMLYLLSLMIFESEVAWAMGGQITSIHLNLLAFGILYTPVSRLLGLLGNALSRKNEFEADGYAVDTYKGEALINALKKLSSDHLSNLTPHPAYVFVHYSHPPLLQRVQAMKEKMPVAQNDYSGAGVA